MSPLVDVFAIPRPRVPEVWPAVAPMLEAAMRRGGEMSMADLYECVASRSAFWLWVAWGGELEAAMVTEIADTIDGRVCVIVALGGENMGRWIAMKSKIEDYARAENCTRMRLYGRKGWARVLTDYRPTRIVLEKELT